MSLGFVWFVGSLVGGLVVREIGVKCVTRQKRPEPIGEPQLERLKQRSIACRSYVPTSEFMLAKTARAAKARKAVKTTQPRAVAALRNA